MPFNLWEYFWIYWTDKCSSWRLSSIRTFVTAPFRAPTISSVLFACSPVGKCTQINVIQNSRLLCKLTNILVTSLSMWSVTEVPLTFYSHVFFFFAPEQQRFGFHLLFCLDYFLPIEVLHFHIASVLTVFIYANIFFVPLYANTFSVPSNNIKICERTIFWIWSLK